MQTSMHMVDPQKAAILGVKEQAPKVQNAFLDATKLDAAGKRKEAERVYLELLNSDFDNCVVLAALGMNYAVAEKNGLAQTLLSKALEKVDDIIPAFKRLGITPKADTDSDLQNFSNIKRSEILNAIGTCYKHENKIEQARDYFVQAQALVPLNADIQNNIGTLFINEGKPEKALEHMNAAIELQPDHAQAHWNKSLATLELGDYKQGWVEYDYGFAASVRVERNFTKAPLPVWDGSPGKNIVVYGEQGIGDEIMFASMLPELIRDSKSVVFECHKRLHTLFGNSFPGIDIYPTREDEMIMWSAHQDGSPKYPFDAKIAIGSLGKFYRPNLGSFPGKPYIQPTVAAESKWAITLNKLGSRPKIGIHWIGGHKRTRVEVRSVHLEQLLPILKQDADFISLQYTHCEAEIAAFEKAHGIKIHHYTEANYSPNYDDEAGLVSNLDLVITVCTSVVHLAGSMGVPCWVLTPSRPAWRYRLDLDYLPWYGKTVTLFRQEPGTTDWQPVIEEVSSNLADLIAATPTNPK